MSQAAAKPAYRQLVVTLAIMALVAAAMWPFRSRILDGFAGFAPHAPDWSMWTRLSPVLQVHVIAATAALVIGAALMLRPKGRGLHKALGWSWVASMGITAISSLFMTGLNGDAYSLIHLLSGWTVVALPIAIYAIRSSNLAMHRRMMSGLFYGGLLVAAAFAFIPGRFMFEFLLG